MRISQKSWIRYKNLLARVDKRAMERMEAYIRKVGGFQDHEEEVIRYAYALSLRYGEASSAAACNMYDAMAEASGVRVPSAEPAETPEYKEVARAVRGTVKNSSEKQIPKTVGRLVKRTGADTTLKNAERDGAQFAWIPMGDTCAFCMTLASRGWQYMSKNALKNGHAEHIHANCDCQYAVRFNDNTSIAGYDPEKYREMYENAEGNTPQEKINSIRRMKYQENKDRLNAQKRAAYAERKTYEIKKNTSTEWEGLAKDHSKEEIQELKEYVEAQGIILDNSFTHFDGDIELIKDFADALNENANQKSHMRKKPVRLSVSYEMKDSTYAETNGSNVIINGFAYRDRELLRKDYEKAVRKRLFTRGSSYLDIPVHESAHVLVFLDQLKSKGLAETVFGKDETQRIKKIKELISEYATYNSDELIAESYVKYKNGFLEEKVLKVLKYCGIL